MSRVYLTYKQHQRLYNWIEKEKKLLVRATRKNPLQYFSKPIVDFDIGVLPHCHADFPDDILWYLNKHCPYKFVKHNVRGSFRVRIRDFRFTRTNKATKKQKP